MADLAALDAGTGQVHDLRRHLPGADTSDAGAALTPALLPLPVAPHLRCAATPTPEEPRMPRSRRRLSLFLAMAAVLSACSSDDGGDASSPTTAPVATEERTFELASAAFPSLSVEIPEEPIASAPAQMDGFTLEVYALTRESEKSVAAVFALRNESGGNMTFQRQLEDPTIEAPVDYTISGVALFDPVNLKRHLVFLDEEGGCLCSTTSTVTVDDGDTLHLAAQFPAPPDDIDAMTLQTPLGSVSDVPLTDA